MTKFELQDRTKRFHISVIKICKHFPKNAAGFEIAKQVIRSAGSVGAITERLAEENQKLILYIKSKSFLKKQMNLFTG